MVRKASWFGLKDLFRSLQTWMEIVQRSHKYVRYGAAGPSVSAPWLHQVPRYLLKWRSCYKQVIWTWYDFCTNLNVVHHLWHIHVDIPVVCRKCCLYFKVWFRVNRIGISTLSSHVMFLETQLYCFHFLPPKAAVLKQRWMEGLSTCYRSKLAQEDPLVANQSAFKPEYPPISRLFVPFPPG